MKNILFLNLFLLLLVSCDSTSTDNTNFNNGQDSTKTESITKPESSISAVWDTTLVIATANIWREARTEGQKDWKAIYVTEIFGFKTAPQVGASLKVLPLRKNLPSFLTKITKVTPRDDMDAGSPQWYEVEVEEVTEKAYFEIATLEGKRDEYPSDLVLVESSDLDAQLLEKESLGAVIFPETITIDLVKAALDFDADGSPDALVCEFCCKNKTSATDCEYTCGATYIKFEEKWHLVDASQPM